MVTGAPLIGWAKPVPVNVRQLRHHRRDYMLVAAAGPASNLVMAVSPRSLLAVLPISPQTLGEANVSAPLATFLSQAMRLNVLLAVFNMIPIPPLDGGNVLGGSAAAAARAHRSIRSAVRVYPALRLDADRRVRDLVVPPVPVHAVLAATVTSQRRAWCRACGRPDGCISAISSARSATGCGCRTSTTASTSSPTGMR